MYTVDLMSLSRCLHVFRHVAELIRTQNLQNCHSLSLFLFLPLYEKYLRSVEATCVLSCCLSCPVSWLREMFSATRRTWRLPSHAVRQLISYKRYAQVAQSCNLANLVSSLPFKPQHMCVTKLEMLVSLKSSFARP